MPAEQQELGWDMDNYPDFVSSDLTLLSKIDIAIVGACPEKIVRKIVRSGKLVFRYTERPLKHGPEPLKYIPRFIRWHYRNPGNSPIYLLCSSAYTYGDYAKFGLFYNRAFKWGYFPKTRYYSDITAFMQRKDRKKILWCGRFLKFKHPDDAIRVAHMLKMDGVDFSLDFIGMGPMEEVMRNMIADFQLENQVNILDSMHPERVRDHMEKAGIYLFTSDFQEGWGAVLNEAMNSGCAVAASHAIGSVPYLLRHKENGLVYHYGDIQSLYEKVRFLLSSPADQIKLGEAAYRTIAEEWNAEVAAERFLKLAEAISQGRNAAELFVDGPCSKAEIIREDWFSE